MPPVVAPTASAAARRRLASRPAARQASAAAASAKRSGRERRRAVASGSPPAATASGTCAALRQRPRYGNSVKGPMPQRPSASPAASAGTSPPSAHTTPSPVITTRRGTRLLGVCPGSHGERGERAGERERQAQRCAAGGRSEQPSGRAAVAARPRIVRRSRHGYPESLLEPRVGEEARAHVLGAEVRLGDLACVPAGAGVVGADGRQRGYRLLGGGEGVESRPGRHVGGPAGLLHHRRLPAREGGRRAGREP